MWLFFQFKCKRIWILSYILNICWKFYQPYSLLVSFDIIAELKSVHSGTHKIFFWNNSSILKEKNHGATEWFRGSKLQSFGIVIWNSIGQMFSSAATAVSQLMWCWLYLFLALTKNKQDEDSFLVLSLVFIYVFLRPVSGGKHIKKEDNTDYHNWSIVKCVQLWIKRGQESITGISMVSCTIRLSEDILLIKHP